MKVESRILGSSLMWYRTLMFQICKVRAARGRSEGSLSTLGWAQGRVEAALSAHDDGWTQGRGRQQKQDGRQTAGRPLSPGEGQEGRHEFHDEPIKGASNLVTSKPSTAPVAEVGAEAQAPSPSLATAPIPC